MIISSEEIFRFFKELDEIINDSINIYIIGGAALLIRGLKTATKDIDLVVNNKKEYLELKKTLQNIKFYQKKAGKEYTHMNVSQIFQKEKYRIDLFKKKVCEKFSLTKDMILRSENIKKFKKINLFLCSNEDIFMFKTMTEREGDLEDCKNIAKSGINWKIILEEIKNQIKYSHKNIWITWIGERLDLLQERGVDIPIMKEINILRNRFFKELNKNISIN